MLDIFSNDAFSVVSLTMAINKLPFTPGRLGRMGLFRTQGITQRTAVIEQKAGRLQLVPTAALGTMPNAYALGGRDARTFNVPWIPLNSSVMATDAAGVRAFGSETELETVSGLIAEKQQGMKDSLEITHEYHRVGAIQGRILDADGVTVLYDLFDEFDITEEEIPFDLEEDTNVSEIKAASLRVIRRVEDILGAVPYRGIHAFCGNEFFDMLIAHEEVKEAFEGVQENAFAREQQTGEGGFPFAGITWENYRGKVGAVDFIPEEEARFVPLGVNDLFASIYAPAPFTETVNTLGKPYYSKQEPMKWDLGIELHANTSPLHICTRPSLLIKGIIGSGS